MSETPTLDMPGDAMAEILVSHEGSLSIITLTRPNARNALSLAMLQGIRSALSELSVRRETRAVIIASKGAVFCAGHDLKELTSRRSDGDKGAAFFRKTMQTCASMMQSIVQCPKPVIAAVQGTATAAGCQLVASCDLAVASRLAQFCTPGVDIGLFCSTPMVALSRNVPRKQAMEMLLTGEMVGAERACEIGLINRVCEPGEELDAARELGQVIARKSPKVLAIGKEAFYQQLEMPLSKAYEITAEVMVQNMLGADAKEGIGAFMDKRIPDWPE